MKTKSNLFKIKILLGLFYFFYFALIGVYVIFFPKLLNDIGFDGFEVGIILSVAPLTRAILPFVFRRFGGLNKKIYKIALLILIFSAFGFFFAIKNFWALLIINTLLGASKGVILPVVETVALHQISKENYGKVRLWGSIGFMAIALWLGKFLSSSFEILYYLIFIALITALASIYLISFDTLEENKNEKRSYKKISLSKNLGWWLSALIFQMSFGGFYSFFTIYETSYSISLEMTTWLWSFGVICEILMLYFQGKLLKKYSLIFLIEISIATTILRWLLLWLFPGSIFVAFVSQSFHALNFALYYTASIAYVYQLYTQKKLAQQFFLGVSFGLGGSLGAMIAGIIYKYSPENLFLYQALFAFFAWILIFVHKQRIKENR